jgi:mannan endo-1,4-beta-mannosidase
MRRAITLAGVLLVAFLAATLSSQPFGPWPSGSESAGSEPPLRATSGIRVQNGRLVEANGNDLILRGINHGFAWHRSQTSSFAGIKAAGANSARISLSMGRRWKPADRVTDVAHAITLCKQNRLICILDAHDTMGLGQQAGAATIDQAVDYWIGLRSALIGQESYAIVNIADEPFGNEHFKTWTAETSNAIRRLRAAGFQNTLLVDAPDWGQDLSFTMRDNAAAVLAADPSGNTVFDIHMYGVFNTAAKVQAYLSSFTSRRLPIVVGEFADRHPYGMPDADAVMTYAQTYRVGYLGWSWSGNSAEVAYLDMVRDFNPSIRTPWGARFIGGVNGLRATSREASVYQVVKQHSPR